MLTLLGRGLSGNMSGVVGLDLKSGFRGCMNISDAFWILLFALGGLGLWRHTRVSRQAYLAASRYTQQQGVTLLDQSVVLKRIWPKFDAGQILALQRYYEFEFSTVGDARYKGHVNFLGPRLQQVFLQPYKAKPDVGEL